MATISLSRLGMLSVLSLILCIPGMARSDEKMDSAELVIRNRVSLTQEGAELILKAAQAKARLMEKNVNIAIVDDGGHPILFVRMNKARPASSYTALTKAVSAATLRAPTGPFGPKDQEPNLLLNFSLQNAASASGGRMTSLYGGVPIIVDGQVIGAVGVGGATGEEDAEIARAGIDALLKQLK
ncbi:MAG TPA: heme-binding protein [Planctomicrobium sp.]|nr:heme-binding protein [Planctomicrobium sp.]